MQSGSYGKQKVDDMTMAGQRLGYLHMWFPENMRSGDEEIINIRLNKYWEIESALVVLWDRYGMNTTAD